MTKSTGTDLVLFTEEILNGKLYFLCSFISYFYISQLAKKEVKLIPLATRNFDNDKLLVQIEIFERILNRLNGIKWDRVYKNGPSKICGRQPIRNLKEYGLQED